MAGTKRTDQKSIWGHYGHTLVTLSPGKPHHKVKQEPRSSCEAAPSARGPAPPMGVQGQSKMGAPILYFQQGTLVPAQDRPPTVTGDMEPGLEPGAT